MKNQVLMEKFRILEYRNRAIFKTKSEGFFWLDTPVSDHEILGYQFHNISTSLLDSLNYRTIRTVSDSTPSIVDVTDMIQKLKRRII